MGKDNLQPIPSLVIHKLSQAQYDREKEAGRLDPNAIYLTPNIGNEVAELSDRVDTLEDDLSKKADSSSLNGLAAVATSGDYKDLSNQVGENVTGQSLETTSGTFATAGAGAEIFNDYSDRTFYTSGLVKTGNVATGNYSHAEGANTNAIGNFSHAESNGTTASGSSAHAEGSQTTASGTGSHAEGYGAKASGYGSHAEGYYTVSTSQGSHAEGVNTTASGNYSHAEGSQTTASSDNSHAEGSQTTASGDNSHAEGSQTTASGDNSHAEGSQTTASGDGSHAEGYSSNKMANITTSTDDTEIQTAWKTKKFSLAKGEASHVEGKDCLALGSRAHAEGYITTASGNYSHAEGYNTTTSGNYGSHAEGYFTTASGSYGSHAEGTSSHKMSGVTTSTTNDEILSVWRTTKFSLAKSEGSHCEGKDCIALNYYSHAEGYGTIASGLGAHAQGGATIAEAQYSHAQGSNTTASGNASSAHGCMTIAQGYAQAVFGKYNTLYDGATGPTDTTGSIFIIGTGANQDTRANAFRITNAGQCMGSQSFATTGADYAEYYEWEDGNPNNEDRRGHFVTFAKGRKIRIANDTDTYILGIVSSTPSVIGNAYTDQWQGMYLTDVFGERLTEIVKVEEEEVKDDEGNVIETIPAHTETRFVINPNYDHTKPYIGRNERQEWAIIGTHGQLVLIDDGTCEEGDFCAVSENGTATKSDSITKYRVTERIDSTHIWVQIL